MFCLFNKSLTFTYYMLLIYLINILEELIHVHIQTHTHTRKTIIIPTWISLLSIYLVITALWCVTFTQHTHLPVLKYIKLSLLRSHINKLPPCYAHRPYTSRTRITRKQRYWITNTVYFWVYLYNYYIVRNWRTYLFLLIKYTCVTNA